MYFWHHTGLPLSEIQVNSIEETRPTVGFHCSKFIEYWPFERHLCWQWHVSRTRFYRRYHRQGHLEWGPPQEFLNVHYKIKEVWSYKLNFVWQVLYILCPLFCPKSDFSLKSLTKTLKSLYGTNFFWSNNSHVVHLILYIHYNYIYTVIKVTMTFRFKVTQLILHKKRWILQVPESQSNTVSTTGYKFQIWHMYM